MERACALRASQHLLAQLAAAGPAMIARLLRGVADRLEPPLPPTVGVVLSPLSMFEREESAAGMRREAALRLMDADTLAYLIVRVAGGPAEARVQVDCAVDDQLWPAVANTLTRIAAEAR